MLNLVIVMKVFFVVFVDVTVGLGQSALLYYFRHCVGELLRERWML